MGTEIKKKRSPNWGGAREECQMIKKHADKWCRDNGYPVPKPTSSQAKRRKTSSHKLRAQAGVQSQQAAKFFRQGTSAQAPDPGYKLRGQRYFFCA